ncbi:hypothetical protein CCP3SC1_370008 [Gammaproteobacteria bacterium]
MQRACNTPNSAYCPRLALLVEFDEEWAFGKIYLTISPNYPSIGKLLQLLQKVGCSILLNGRVL